MLGGVLSGSAGYSVQVQEVVTPGTVEALEAAL